MKSIYLDHAAGTPLRSDVLTVMLPHFTGTYGNPSSLHHQGRLSAHIVTAARAQVSSALEVSPEEIIFTCSGTEANNLALLGVAHAHKDRGKHILVSCIEHPSILEAYPLVRVIEHFDHPSDEVWSTRLDALIDIVFPGHRPTLYGSRDSFIPHYSGVNKVELIPDIESVTGTALRESVKEHVACSSPFRSGIIHTHATRFPIVYPVVDVAIINPERRMVLLGEKETDQGKRRFIGGFVDPTIDDSLEFAARREAFEETGGLEVDTYTYLGSTRIDDWRYRGSKDCVMSSFFKAQYIFGHPRASDDIDALHWTPYEEVMERLAESHKPLGELLMRSLNV